MISNMGETSCCFCSLFIVCYLFLFCSVQSIFLSFSQVFPTASISFFFAFGSPPCDQGCISRKHFDVQQPNRNKVHHHSHANRVRAQKKRNRAKSCANIVERHTALSRRTYMHVRNTGSGIFRDELRFSLPQPTTARFGLIIIRSNQRIHEFPGLVAPRREKGLARVKRS